MRRLQGPHRVDRCACWLSGRTGLDKRLGDKANATKRLHGLRRVAVHGRSIL